MTEFMCFVARRKSRRKQKRESETSLLIVGHGTALNDRSAVAAKREVEKIAALGRYAAVLNAYMEESPLISRLGRDSQRRPTSWSCRSSSLTDCTATRTFRCSLGIEPSRRPPPADKRSSVGTRIGCRAATFIMRARSGQSQKFAEIILEQVLAFDRAVRLISANFVEGCCRSRFDENKLDEALARPAAFILAAPKKTSSLKKAAEIGSGGAELSLGWHL